MNHATPASGAIPKSEDQLRPSKRALLKYRLRVAMREPTSLIGVVVALIFTYLILVPILSMLVQAVTVQFGDERRTALETASWTFYYLNRTFFSAISRDLSGSRC